MKNISATKLYALAFGIFLGLCLWKFGNPVILDHKSHPPATAADWLTAPWPTHWANWLLLPLAGWGALLVFRDKTPWPQSKWLWRLPLAWLGWQFISATQTVDTDLTHATLGQFAGCVAGYFLGALIFAREQLWRWLLPGLLAVFVFCLVRGVDQRVFEFPQNYQALVESERAGWTNYPPEAVARGIEGEVILLLNLSDNGELVSASIARSSGHPLLDQAALDAARHIGALPGNPRQTLFPVSFRLR